MTSLLIVDDSVTLCEVLRDAFTRRGFEVRTAHNVAEALEVARSFTPEYVVLDLKMPGDSGLTLIPPLLAIDPYTRIVVLTGYAHITTAVEAIKLGAMHYLAKPVDADAILAAFEKEEGDPHVPVESAVTSLNKLEWNYLKAALERNQGNISVTARELGVHRRTLYRKLDKMPK